MPMVSIKAGDNFRLVSDTNVPVSFGLKERKHCHYI